MQLSSSCWIKVDSSPPWFEQCLSLSCVSHPMLSILKLCAVSPCFKPYPVWLVPPDHTFSENFPSRANTMNRRFTFYTRASQSLWNWLISSTVYAIAIFAETRPRRFADIVSAAVLITKLDFEAFWWRFFPKKNFGQNHFIIIVDGKEITRG